LALLSSNLRFSTNDYWATARLPDKILLTVILVCGIGYLSFQAQRRTNETVLLDRAKNPKLLLLERATALTKAFALEPKNFETAYKIGEAYRIQSFQGNPGYQSLAQTAMQWYARTWKLDPYYGYAFLRYGMCLDWLNRSDEAEYYFSQADALDPNGYTTAAIIGWHYAQIGDYAAARTWLMRSRTLSSKENEIAQTYLKLVDNKLFEEASSKTAN
jgi:tetratricopeptide (TPR) repeat protein